MEKINKRLEIDLEKESVYCQIYKSYYKKMYLFGISQKFEHQIVEDCIQDVFLKLYLKNIKLPEESKLKSFLFKCLINALLDHARKKKNQFISLNKEAEINIIQEDFHGQHLTDDRLLKDFILLKQQINKLNERQKRALQLKYIEEKSWNEMAEVFNISPHSCMNLVSRIILKLRESFLKHGIVIFFLLSEIILIE